jgi:hypothetical protein
MVLRINDSVQNGNKLEDFQLNRNIRAVKGNLKHLYLIDS